MSELLCSVIIVTWNRRKELELAIDSILAQTIAAKLEVIVVDNGSTDGTVEWLQTAYDDRLRLFQFAENRGACHGRNAGIHLARAKHICFLDSDALILELHTLETCLKALNTEPAIRAVAVPIWFDRARTRPFCLGGYITPHGYFFPHRSFTETEDPDMISSCFAVWEKGMLMELRGFDPWFFWGIEDMDLALRARWNALRGAPAGTQFRIIMDGAVLHEMSQGGRHFKPGDFLPSFHAFERQRLRLVMGYGGLREFFKVLILSVLQREQIARDAWMKRMTRREWFWALLAYPAIRLFYLPIDAFKQRQNHLESTPVPITVRDSANPSVRR